MLFKTKVGILNDVVPSSFVCCPKDFSNLPFLEAVFTRIFIHASLSSGQVRQVSHISLHCKDTSFLTSIPEHLKIFRVLKKSMFLLSNNRRSAIVKINRTSLWNFCPYYGDGI